MLLRRVSKPPWEKMTVMSQPKKNRSEVTVSWRIILLRVHLADFRAMKRSLCNAQFSRNRNNDFFSLASCGTFYLYLCSLQEEGRMRIKDLKHRIEWCFFVQAGAAWPCATGRNVYVVTMPSESVAACTQTPTPRQSFFLFCPTPNSAKRCIPWSDNLLPARLSRFFNFIHAFVYTMSIKSNPAQFFVCTSVAQKNKPLTMLSFHVQSIDLPVDCTARGPTRGGNAPGRHFWWKQGIANGLPRMNLKLDLGFTFRLRLDLPYVWPGLSRLAKYPGILLQWNFQN